MKQLTLNEIVWHPPLTLEMRIPIYQYAAALSLESRRVECLDSVTGVTNTQYIPMRGKGIPVEGQKI